MIIVQKLIPSSKCTILKMRTILQFQYSEILDYFKKYIAFHSACYMNLVLATPLIVHRSLCSLDHDNVHCYAPSGSKK